MTIFRIARIASFFLLAALAIVVIGESSLWKQPQHAYPHLEGLNLLATQFNFTANAQLEECDCTETKPAWNCGENGVCTAYHCVTTGNVNKKCQMLPTDDRPPCGGCLRSENVVCDSSGGCFGGICF